MDLSKRMYVYMDENVLQEEAIETWLAWFAQHHRQMILITNSVWEEETVKACPGYGYICRTLYTDRFAQALAMDRAYHKGHMKEILLLSDRLYAEDTAVLQLHVQKEGGVAALMQRQACWLRRLRRILSAIIALCLLYFVLYFSYLAVFPHWMQEGFVAFLFCFVPLAILVGSMMYGIAKEVFPLAAFLELLLPL